MKKYLTMFLSFLLIATMLCSCSIMGDGEAGDRGNIQTDDVGDGGNDTDDLDDDRNDTDDDRNDADDVIDDIEKDENSARNSVRDGSDSVGDALTRGASDVKNTVDDMIPDNNMK